MAILVVYLLIAGSIVGVGLLVVPPIVKQVDQLAKDIPGYVKDLRNNKQFRKYDDKYHISAKLNDQAQQAASHLGEAAGALQSITVGVFGALVQLVTVLTMTFFLLLDGERLAGFLLGLRGPSTRTATGDRHDIYRSIAGYVAGNLMISVIAGIVDLHHAVDPRRAVRGPALGADGLPRPDPAGRRDARRRVDRHRHAVQRLPDLDDRLAVVFILYQQVENNVIQPIVYRRTVDVRRSWSSWRS